MFARNALDRLSVKQQCHIARPLPKVWWKLEEGLRSE